jgi:CheY-like chemotaxis protein
MAKQCLVVDDVEVSQYVISILMEELGYEVVLAHDGAEAKKCLDGKAFDVILLDWHLRKKSGLELIPEIRSHPNGGRVPIIVCTGVELDKEFRDIADSNVQGFLKKPTTREGLQNELQRIGL